MNSGLLGCSAHTHRQEKAKTQICWYLPLQYCTDNGILYGRWIVAGQRHNICWAGEEASTQYCFLTYYSPSLSCWYYISCWFPAELLWFQHLTFFQTIQNKLEAQEHTAQPISVKYQQLFPMWQIFVASLKDLPEVSNCSPHLPIHGMHSAMLVACESLIRD